MTSLVFETVMPRRIYRVIADQIAEKIRNGTFAVGSRLPSERDLAELMQVSRSSVREALIALEIRGLVDVRVGSGVFVLAQEAEGDDDGAAADAQGAGLDASPFELLDVRLMIEPDGAALAAQTGTAAQISEIRRIFGAMSASSSPDAFDRDFHAAIAAASNNAVLESSIAHLWALSQASTVCQRFDQYFVNAQSWELALIEHERIVLAIEARDPLRARNAMNQHLVAIVARLHEEAPAVPGALELFDKKRGLLQDAWARKQP